MSHPALTSVAFAQPPSELYLLAINITRRCNLACEHCYLDAQTLQQGADNELSTADINRVLDQVASRGTRTMVVLTGGEPLARSDLENMISHGTELGLSMVVGSNGTLLTRRRVASLKAAGTMGVGVSIDSLNADYHDAFRGLNGSLSRTLAGIEHCRELKLSFQIHFTVTRHNYSELDNIIEFARLKGARVINFFFLICTGRAESRSDLSPEQYEQILSKIIQAQAKHPELIIRPRCAPHFRRIAHQLNPQSAINQVSGLDGDGCIAGSHYCRITPEGDVTACPYIEHSAGNIHQQDFIDIWDQAEDFQRLRTPQLQGACGECEYRKLCGGCRARPVAMGGDLLDADPFCAYVPQGQTVIEPYNQTQPLQWQVQAQERLNRIPGFIQKIVKQRVEAYVLEQGDRLVTPEHMREMIARRFGSEPSFKRPFSHSQNRTKP